MPGTKRPPPVGQSGGSILFTSAILLGFLSGLALPDFLSGQDSPGGDLDSRDEPPRVGAPQIPPQLEDPFHLPELVVTATGSATPRALLPQAVTVLDGSDLRARGVTFLADALSEVPGLAVVRTGSIGATTSVFMRGGNSNFVKVLLDGVPLNEPGGRFDFGSLTLENIERIEVVRGPSSVLYGSDAVAGVIQLFTRDGRDGSGAPVVSGFLRGGSLGSWSGEVGTRGASARQAWSASVGRNESSGAYSLNNRFTALVGSGRLELFPDDETRLALALRVHESRHHFPTDGSGEISDLNQFTFDDGFNLSLEGIRSLGPGLEGRVLVRIGEGKRGFENEPDSPADTLGFGYRDHRLGMAVRRGADARLTWQGEDLRVTGGVDWELERERLQTQTESNFGAGSSTSADTFGEDRWNLAGYGQVEVDGWGGSRWNAGLRADQNEVFGNFLTGQAGLVVPVPGLGRVRAGAGTAFKAPTFSHQFADTPFERGNRELKPETSRSVEIGWDGGFIDNRLVLSLSTFRQEYQELIHYENRGDDLPTYFNESEARSTGVEGSAAWRTPSGFFVGVEYTRIHARAVTEDPEDLMDGEEPRLLRRPDRQLSGRIQVPFPVRMEGASAGVQLHHVGNREDDDFSTFPATRVTLDAYTTADLDVRLPVQSFLLTLRVENLADTDYTSVVGFPGVGRRIFAGVRWNP